MNYEGKLVFIEACGIEFDGKGIERPASTYRNGEYLCVRHTPHCLYGVSLKGKYESHKLECFNLKGRSHYQVVGSSDGIQAARELVIRLVRFAEERNNPKPQWVSSVYDTAIDTARQIDDMLVRVGAKTGKVVDMLICKTGTNAAVNCIASASPESVVLTVPAGVKRLEIVLAG